MKLILHAFNIPNSWMFRICRIDLSTRAWTALILTTMTVLGFCIVLIGCFLTKPVIIGIGMTVMVAPFVGLVAYVCWDDACRAREEQVAGWG